MAQQFAGASSHGDDSTQDAVNAELARNPSLLEDNEPYVPMYARSQMHTTAAPSADKRANPLTQLGDLSRQDKFVSSTKLAVCVRVLEEAKLQIVC